MKLYLLILLYLCVNLNIFAGYQATSATTSLASEMYLSSNLTSNNLTQVDHLLNTVTPYPTMGIYNSSENNTYNVVQATSSRITKSMIPAKVRPLARHAGLSILHPSKNAFVNYPAGSTLFNKYPDLALQFDTMIQDFTKNPQFLTFFRKVHINVLNQLYHHLMCIYMNFNLQHPGITQNNDGNLNISVPLFLQEETSFAANIKTLIVNHLMNVIESQFNSAIRSYAQNIPQTFATYIGKTAIQNDYSIDLSQFIIHQIQPNLAKNKQLYIQALSQYLLFFQTYTQYLNQPHPINPESLTAFVDIAQSINQYLYANTSQNQDKYTIALSKMNPPLFHFSYDDMRALKIIPYLATQLPQNSSNITWPSHIIQAAQEGLVLNIPGHKPHPIAYFRTPDGTIVRNFKIDTSIPLYICMRLGENLFEQQLIPQPDWLNSWEGIVKILQACYGNFAAILGMNILDPIMEALISNVILAQQGKDINQEQNIYPEAQKQIAKLQELLNKTSFITTSSSANSQPNQTTSLPNNLNIPALPQTLPSLSSLSPSMLPTQSTSLPNLPNAQSATSSLPELPSTLPPLPSSSSSTLPSLPPSLPTLPNAQTPPLVTQP